MLPEISRRVFLRRGLRAVGTLAALPRLGLGAAAAAPLAGACAAGDGAGAPEGLRVLSPGQWVVLDAVADALVPRGGAFAPGARDVDLARRVDAFLAGEPPEVARGLASALWLVEWTAGPLAGRVGRFSRLDAEDRSRALDALARAPLALLRDVYAGLRGVCLFLFYAADASWPALGYDGPWVARAAGVAGRGRAGP